MLPSTGNSITNWCYGALISFALLLVASFVVADTIAPAGRRVAKVTGVDPTGYFGVSHALLFHQNFDLADEYQHVKPADNPWTALRKETGHYGSSWAVGYSILAMPLLGAGTLIDALAGNPADGYSRFAILGYCLTNVVLTSLGLMALFAFTRSVAEFWGTSSRAASLYGLFTAVTIFFGTNVGYYAFSPMSHAATFFCASLFLAYWWRVRDRTDVASWALLGLIGGFLSITRWQEVFFLTAPIVSDLLSGWDGLLSKLRSRLVYGAVALLCWIPQFLEWKYIFGKYLANPELNGFFVFPPPYILHVLFSTRNGWVTWTPLVVLGLGGLIWGAWKKPLIVAPWIVVILLEIGLIGSLPTTWHGGQEFSARYLTSNASLIALGLVTLLCLSSRNSRVLAMSVAVVCCLFTVVSAVQVRLDLVPKSDRLTASEYWTDKFRLLKVRRRKQSVEKAEVLLQQGSASAAVATLEATEIYGPDRDVLAELSKAYRATGREEDAEDASRRLAQLMNSRLF